MLTYIIIAVISFFVSALTLFSGFGLGTMLMPVLALFFPIPVAIAMTGCVHLMNNIFKVILFGKHANKKVLLQFGIPAVLAAWVGASCLVALEEQGVLFRYMLGNVQAEVSWLKLIMATLILFFALSDLKKKGKSQGNLIAGGASSGFLGGLSGHQGALRSSYLMGCNLSKEAFIGTGVVIACFVDLIRLVIYNARFFQTIETEAKIILAVATGAAFLGVFVCKQFFQKVTMDFIHRFVRIMLIVIACMLAFGII